MGFEGVCGTLSGGRFWSSKREALSSEGVRGTLLELDFEVDFGAQSGELWVLRVSVESFLEVAFGTQSGELCVLRASVEPFWRSILKWILELKAGSFGF